MVVIAWVVWFCTGSSFIVANDETRIWLPQSYQKYYLSLVKSVEMLEATEQCKIVVRATLHQKSSTFPHPVFRIICRNPANRTYAVLIDGLSFKDVTPVKTPKKSPDEINRQQQRYWQFCHDELTKKTKNMLSLEWLTETMPEVTESNGRETVFTVDFNAQSLDRKLLRYRASCTFRPVKKSSGANAAAANRGRSFDYDIVIRSRPGTAVEE